MSAVEEPTTLSELGEADWFCPRVGCWFAGTEFQVYGHIGAKHIKTLKPIRHGTVRGYRAEKNRDMTTCPACRLAWRRYYSAAAKAARRILRREVP